MKFRAPGSGFTKVPNTVSSQNVDLRVNATTAMHIRALRGQVVTLKGTVPALDVPTSFKIRVTAATVLDGAGLRYPGRRAPTRRVMPRSDRLLSLVGRESRSRGKRSRRGRSR